MADTSHLVITVHGIRTYGNWQDGLKKLLEAAEPNITVRMYRYGFFSSLAFLIPPLRWLVGRQFRSFFENEIRSVPEGARIDIVAHSFGTYLAASALKHLPERRKIHTVIFAGSVLPPSFPWYKYLQSGAVGRVVNECGWDDSVLVLCQSTALLMGMAGRLGFRGMIGDRFKNRYFRGGHGLYFDAHHEFMREKWVPLLTGEGEAADYDQRPPLTAIGGIRLFLLSNMHFIKVCGAFLLLLTAIMLPLDWYRKAAYKKEAERINHIALLTNAQEIPGRDPTHVRDLLKIDAGSGRNADVIDNLMSTEVSPDSRDSEAADEDAEPGWWEAIPGLFDHSREAYRARLRHHRANQQLVASNRHSGAAGKAKALTLYRLALASYKKINDNDPAHGSYALCLMDYAQLLEDMGEHDKAIEQFRLARETAFPETAPNRPTSLAVDSLIAESLSWKALQKWPQARECLSTAVATAEKKQELALLSDAHNESAWFHMDRLEVDDAVKEFEQAEDACRAIMRGQVVYKIRLFHIRHGRALALRLQGNAAQAYEKYQQIVSDLQALMSKDLTFTPKQRRDLRDRLFNSMERRADVRLFARSSGAASAAEGQSQGLTAAAAPSSATSSDDSTTVEDDYQEALDLIGNDELVWKVRLLYKKVIARFAADLQEHTSFPFARFRGRHRILDTTDLDYAEAHRTFRTLPSGAQRDLELYDLIAQACMALRASATPQEQFSADRAAVHVTLTRKGPAAAPGATRFGQQAVEKLRSLAAKYAAAGVAQFTREKVEMLLLAHEILVGMGIEPDPAKRAADATRMMSVLGVSTDVASHPELAPYFERFQRIAVAQTSSGPATVAGNESGAGRYEVMRPVFSSTEIVRFSLKLGPWLELTLTTQRPLEPQAVRNSRHAAPNRVEALSKTP